MTVDLLTDRFLVYNFNNDDTKKKRPITLVLQKSGLRGYLNILPRISFSGALTVLSSEIRFFAKPKNVIGIAITTQR